MQILMGLVGPLFLMGIAWALSENRRAIRWRTILPVFALQAGLGALVLYVPFGHTLLLTISHGVQAVIDSANAGISFLFGGLAGDRMHELFGNGGFVFAIQVLPVIVFFSSLISVLYYLGIMRWVIQLIGGAIHRLAGTSYSESMSASANIFVGQTEAPLVVRPFIERMTRSELFAVMVGGLASVAGSTLAGYAALGVELKYLIAASFMAAPGGLLMAKLMVPETDTPEHHDRILKSDPDEPVANVIDAAATGASAGVRLALNVGGMLLAFISLIAVINMLFGVVGGWFGYDGLTLQTLLGYLFAPLAFLIGVPWQDAIAAGSFIGQKIVLNEFVAYVQFAEHSAGLSEHTRAIVTFALCGFANLSSIAILMGGLGGMAPSRRHEIARLGMRAIVAGTLSNLMSATLAGLFIAL
ncbi:NupC/NupG family nucleoside CNT transporter [Kushneria phosphatilytica]|uniref:Nucleoside permease n=1 Tax=Kushneria phosphatilytica TaxID=657387 RepID=A0A1S1NYY6_9GAMM|nr:NupC/NupG family nucleoside CNT transporter [Kushneria phosphatilytica]OHV12952.1 nucleoside transporter NupC [Kushneria phosphatilytica]QEL10820.1 NupC/NupG family nucleoside CNT transporter [Kushneria phosphatilytica]